MKNAGAVAIRKAMQQLRDRGLETALEREGSKGCSSDLRVGPVALEPPYQRFDSGYVLAVIANTAPPLPPRPRAPRVTYVTFLVYPAVEDQLDLAWMETMLRALGVLTGPFALELYGNCEHVWVRFAVPKRQIAGFQAALLGHFPALRLQQIADPFPPRPPIAVNEVYPVGPYQRSFTLLGANGASPLSLATHVLTALPQGAMGMLQVLFCPAAASSDWHFNIHTLLNAEQRAAQDGLLGGLSPTAYDRILPPLLEPSAQEKVRVDVAFFAVVVRYALWGAPHATAFLQGMRVATGMLRFGNRAWRVLSHDDLLARLGDERVQRMLTHRLSHRHGVMLTSSEVASLVHIPNARALQLAPALAQRVGLEWAAFPDEAASARLGTNRFAGDAQAVTIPLPVRLRHMYVCGVTGCGKSTLLARLAVDDAVAGVGWCVVDPHGDLCRDIVQRLPAARLADLVYLSFGEQGMVPRWNPFSARVPAGKLADDMTRAFLAMSTVVGARMEHNFRMLSYIVHALGGTLEDLADLAHKSPRGEHLRTQALEQIANPQVQRFLRTELPSYRPSQLDSVTNKLSRLLLDENLGAMFRQRENTIDPRTWMDEGKLVLVNLAAGVIGSDHARFVGSLLVSLIYRAALTRAEQPERERRPFLLAIDEFQTMQAATLAELVSEGRKYALGSILAHQERGQLRKELGRALGNCAIKVVFRPSEDDLPFVQRLCGGLEPEVFRTLGVGEAIVSCGDRRATLTTELCPYPPVRAPDAIVQQYAHQYYAPIETPPATTRRRRVYDTFGAP